MTYKSKLNGKELLNKVDYSSSNGKLIYLACPYTHKYESVMEDRTQKATKVAAMLMEDRNNVFSPLTHSHALVSHMEEDLQTSFSFWLSRDLQIIDFCTHVYVLMLDGWDESKGVAVEIAYAKEWNIPIKFLNEEGEIVG